MSGSRIMCGLPIIDIPEFKSVDQNFTKMITVIFVEHAGEREILNERIGKV